MSSAGVVTMRLDGGARLRSRLMAMDAEVTLNLLGPLLAKGAEMIRAAAQRMAPVKTGALARSIAVEWLKSGVGYLYLLIGPKEEAGTYYGRFQEFGLGTGASSPPSARTLRRRANYEHVMNLKRSGYTTTGFQPGEYGLFRDGRQVATGSTYTRYELHKLRHGQMSGGGLMTREYKSLRNYEKTGFMQGMRRPDMAAHPFMRPAAEWQFPYIRQMIISRLREIIRSHAVQP